MRNELSGRGPEGGSGSVDREVLIAGAGPTGLMLAGELALAGVDVAVLERRPDQGLAGSRAGGLHARTIEVLDQRGIAERFLDEGQQAQVAGFAGVRLDISGFPTRHPYGLGLWQNRIEAILAGWVGELGVAIEYGTELSGFSQDPGGVDAELSDGRRLRAAYLVGCDGGRSFVRRTAGIEFTGSDPTTSNLIAEVEMRDKPELGIRRDARGVHSLGRFEYEIRDGEVIYADSGPVGVMLTEEGVGPQREPTLDELRDNLIAVYGTDFGAHSPTWIQRFTDAARQASAYREGRVLLAGDAAHVHPPDGGQGLNTGVQDAANLGWKLARVVRRRSPRSLLDSYEAERRPVGARVLRDTLAQVAMRRADDRTQAVRETIAELLEMDEPRLTLAARMSGLGIRYELGAGHPLVGRRMPDLDLATVDGPTRVYPLLHDGRGLVLAFGGREPVEARRWSGEVRVLKVEAAESWELPAIGAVAAPDAVLVRPDGYVAWAGDASADGLAAALETWFGEPA